MSKIKPITWEQYESLGQLGEEIERIAGEMVKERLEAPKRLSNKTGFTGLDDIIVTGYAESNESDAD
jgi:hypothetical protein